MIKTAFIVFLHFYLENRKASKMYCPQHKKKKKLKVRNSAKYNVNFIRRTK